MKKIGIFGGTFNPIHMGHLAIAQMAQEKFKLDKVIFVPSFLPPHKSVSGLANAKERFAMVKLAIAGNDRFALSDVETRRGGKSYTVETLRYFKTKLPPGVKLYFIIGGDSLPTLPYWKDIGEITTLATFIVVNRPGYVKPQKHIKYLTVDKPGIDISSSYLRGRLRAGKSIRYLVPEKIFNYIETHKLYTQQTFKRKVSL